MQSGETLEIHDRPVLPDKIRFNITPFYENVAQLRKKDKNGYNLCKDEFKDFFKLGFRSANDKKFLIRRYGRKINIDIPDENFPSYVTHVSIALKQPYSISMEFNFIRFLKDSIAKSKHKNKFRYNYDDKIKLNEDNFISFETWPYWDSNYVQGLLKYDLPAVALEIARQANDILVPDIKVPYEQITIKQIEFNSDYYVGLNNSGFIIDRFQSYFYATEDSKEFMKNCTAIAKSHQIKGSTYANNSRSTTGYHGYSIQWELGKGLKIKAYRKTRDHIRLELSMTNEFIKYKIKKGGYKYENAFWPLFELSKDLFHDINFTDTLRFIFNNNTKFKIPTSMVKWNSFIEWYNPILHHVMNAIEHGEPITDKAIIRSIQKDPELRKFFIKKWNDNQYIYIYDPDKALLERHNKKVQKELILENETRLLERRFGVEGKGHRFNAKDLGTVEMIKWKHGNEPYVVNFPNKKSYQV